MGLGSAQQFKFVSRQLPANDARPPCNTPKVNKIDPKNRTPLNHPAIAAPTERKHVEKPHVSATTPA